MYNTKVSQTVGNEPVSAGGMRGGNLMGADILHDVPLTLRTQQGDGGLADVDLDTVCAVIVS